MSKFLFAFAAFFYSCSDKYEPTAKWDDNILLSTKDVDFADNADSVKITTGGDWWWINAVTVNNKSYKFYNSEDIDLESDNYVI